MGSSRAALFFDRDGVLNEPVWDEHTGSLESPLREDDVRLVSGAAQAVQRANDHGLTVVVVSNQPAAAKQVVTATRLRSVHDRVVELIAQEGGRIDSSYLCLHHPAGTDPSLGRTCTCRKPLPGLLEQAATDLGLALDRSWLIGDTDADIGAARNAGLAGVVLIEHPRSAHRRSPEIVDGADVVVSTVEDAMNAVVERMQRSGDLPRVQAGEP